MRDNRLLDNYERNKAKGSRPAVEKRSFSYKEWVGIVISCAAFGLSALTTYLSTFRAEDDIRVVPAPWAVLRQANSTEIRIFTNGDWVFTNAGNRAASILGAIWVLVKDSANDENCLANGNNLNVASFDLKPFVIQPKQVETRHVEWEGQDSRGQKVSITILRQEMTGEFDRKSPVKVKICLVVFLITPDDAMRVSQTVYSALWNFSEQSSYGPDVPYGKAPWILVKKTKSTLFN